MITKDGRARRRQLGGLIVYAANLLDMLRCAGGYVDKALKGAKPGDLAIEQPTKFELVINMKAVKVLGLAIAPSLLLRADQAEKEDGIAMHRRRFVTTISAGLVLAGPAGAMAQAARIKPGARDVLIVVDIQNCFVPGGTLPVPGGDQIVSLVNRLARAFENVVLTMDWHTADHVSFASSHPGKKPFEIVSLPYGTQVLWPDHCIQGTKDAELVPGLQIAHAQLVIRKGYRRHIDSYSAFFEADGKTPTGLTGYLRERGIQRTFFVGLATDFCVAWSALDARKSGFTAYVIEDATRGIDAGGSLGKAWQDMTGAGVKRMTSSDIELP